MNFSGNIEFSIVFIRNSSLKIILFSETSKDGEEVEEEGEGTNKEEEEEGTSNTISITKATNSSRIEGLEVVTKATTTTTEEILDIIEGATIGG